MDPFHSRLGFYFLGLLTRGAQLALVWVITPKVKSRKVILSHPSSF